MRRHIPASLALCLTILLPEIGFAQEAAAPQMEATELTPEALKTAYAEKQWARAAEIAAKLLESEPENVDYLAIEGISYAQQEQNERAEQIFLKIQKLRPDDPQNLGNLCYAQSQLDRKDTVDVCKKAAELNPDKASINFLAGQALENAKRLDEAKELYGVALKLEPDNIRTLTTLTNVYYMQKDYRHMADYTEDAIKRGIEVPILYLNLTSAPNFLGEYEKTIEWADKGIEKYKDPGLKLAKGEALYRLNRIDEASKTLHEASEGIQEGAVMWPRMTYYLARVMLLEPCTEGAEGTCVTDDDACCVKAQNAAAMLEAASKRKTMLNDSNCDVFTGLAYMMSGDLEKAEAILSKATHGDMNQDNASALAALAVTLYQFSDTKDKAAALQYYRQALDASPDFSDPEKIQKTRQWPKKAVDILGQIKAEAEKPAKSKSGCGCEITSTPNGSPAPMAGLLGILGMLGLMFRWRRKRG